MWPSSRMVPTMPSAVSGLTKQEAPSRGVASSCSSSASAAFTARYWPYIAPPRMATVLPISACGRGEAPASTTTPAPSLPTGSDWPSRGAAMRAHNCGGIFAVTLASSPEPETLAVERSAGPSSRPRSDGLIGEASTRTRISSSSGVGIGTRASDSCSSPSFTSERSCSPVP